MLNSSTYSDDLSRSVVLIEYHAFESSGLVDLVISTSVTSIGNGAFYSCYKLTAIVLPTSVVVIGDWAFYYSSLLTLIVPTSVEYIGSVDLTFPDLEASLYLL
eukprot:gene39402-53273_t